MSSNVRAGSLAARFPVYQIDFAAVCSGKRIASTKRRIRWRFGFTNPEALESGETGTSCRGEEHDVTIIWSITSGKRQISCDGQEVHFSTNRSGTIEFSWPMRGGHMVSVVANASPPMTAKPGFRQYDLFVDGQSFFSMPKVYELGIRGPSPSHARSPVGAERQRALPPVDQEDEDLQRAIRESLEESRNHLATRNGYDNGYSNQPPPPQPVPAAAPAPASDLLGFDAPAPAPTPPAFAAPAASYDAHSVASGALVPQPAATGYPGAPPVAYDSYTVATAPQPQAAPGLVSPYGVDSASFTSAPQPVPMVDPLTQPVPPTDDPFAPKAPPPPTQNDIHSAILGAYGGEPGPSPGYPATPVAQQGAPNPTYQTPQLENGTGYNAAAPAGPQLSMNSPLEEEKKTEPLNDVDRALKNLVNFDDISAPAEQEMSLTMKPKEEKKGNTNKSKPIAPKAVFGAATLLDIKTKAPPAPAKNPEEIMKPPPQLFSPDAVHAGALVVHGQGPPPLQPQGFGYAAQAGGYGMPPQMQYQQQAYNPPPQYAYNNY